MIMADQELQNKLEKRNMINEGDTTSTLPSINIFNPYTEFKEFSRKEIQDFQQHFNKFDVNKDKFIDFCELKLMMEKLGCAQTHLSLKEMIRQVDEDNDERISFREFLLIIQKAASGDFLENDGLLHLYRNIVQIDVEKEGVKGAKNFFQAKIEEQSSRCRNEEDIRLEQEEKRRTADEAKLRHDDFVRKASLFNQAN